MATQTTFPTRKPWRLILVICFKIDIEAYIKRAFEGIVKIDDSDTIIIREPEYFKGVQVSISWGVLHQFSIYFDLLLKESSQTMLGGESSKGSAISCLLKIESLSMSSKLIKRECSIVQYQKGNSNII